MTKRQRAKQISSTSTAPTSALLATSTGTNWRHTPANFQADYFSPECFSHVTGTISITVAWENPVIPLGKRHIAQLRATVAPWQTSPIEAWGNVVIVTVRLPD